MNPSTSTSTRKSHEILFLMPGDFLPNVEIEKEERGKRKDQEASDATDFADY